MAKKKIFLKSSDGKVLAMAAVVAYKMSVTLRHNILLSFDNSQDAQFTRPDPLADPRKSNRVLHPTLLNTDPVPISKLEATATLQSSTIATCFANFVQNSWMMLISTPRFNSSRYVFFDFHCFDASIFFYMLDLKLGITRLQLLFCLMMETQQNSSPTKNTTRLTLESRTNTQKFVYKSYELNT